VGVVVAVSWIRPRLRTSLSSVRTGGAGTYVCRLSSYILHDAYSVRRAYILAARRAAAIIEAQVQYHDILRDRSIQRAPADNIYSTRVGTLSGIDVSWQGAAGRRRHYLCTTPIASNCGSGTALRDGCVHVVTVSKRPVHGQSCGVTYVRTYVPEVLLVCLLLSAEFVNHLKVFF